MPGDLVLILVLEDVLRSTVRRDVNPLRDGGRTVEAEVLHPPEVGQDLLRLARHYAVVSQVERIRVDVVELSGYITYRTWDNGSKLSPV